MVDFDIGINLSIEIEVRTVTNVVGKRESLKDLRFRITR